ncbi:MAG: FAD-dependent oxidoreductase, partial [Geodermatophilaceae bacterium]|nr:FAD-dependent oxidoreductase [Geodermatophilaceae bacterium]
VLLVIPWGEHWLIGTTDTPWTLDRDHPVASGADIDYLLDQVNVLLRAPLTRADVTGVFAGLRPLVDDEAGDTAAVSREHVVREPRAGLVTVAGGKYTTYRVMAADAVDAATAGLVGTPASRTARLPLVGARSYARVCSGRSLLAQRHEIPLSTVESLLRRYGDRVVELLELIADRPELARPLPGAPDHLAVEVWYAALAEGALHLDDVLTRRTRISVQTPHRGLESADRVCELMGEVLRWPPAVREREIEHYRTRVAAERESQLMPDDRTADAARLGAPDVRAGA